MIINAMAKKSDINDIDKIANDALCVFESGDSVCAVFDYSIFPQDKKWSIIDFIFAQKIAQRNETKWVNPTSASKGWSLLDELVSSELNKFDIEMDFKEDPSINALSSVKTNKSRNSLLDIENQRKRQEKFNRRRRF